MMTAPTRSVILKRIKEELQMLEQWREGDNLNFALDHQTRAIALIELLEVHDCGSVGGFAPGQTDQTIKGRYEWLRTA